MGSPGSLNYHKTDERLQAPDVAAEVEEGSIIHRQKQLQSLHIQVLWQSEL